MTYLVLVTGLTHEDPVNDPDLTERSRGIIIRGARELAKVGMIQFDELHSKFAITDVGRIAAKYYIRHASIEIFQKEFKPRMTEADVLGLLSMSTEVSAMSGPLTIHQTPSSLTKFKCEKMKLRNSKFWKKRYLAPSKFVFMLLVEPCLTVATGRNPYLPRKRQYHGQPRKSQHLDQPRKSQHLGPSIHLKI